MKKFSFLLTAAAVLLVSASVEATVSTTAPPPAAPRKQEPRTANATCYATNSYGQTFYWYGPNSASASRGALAVCQQNTPIGAVCWVNGCQLD